MEADESMNMENRKLLGVAETAAQYGPSLPWWRALILKKGIRYYKLGRRVMLDRADIERMLEASRVEARAVELANRDQQADVALIDRVPDTPHGR